jgi:hypothetical protein
MGQLITIHISMLYSYYKTQDFKIIGNQIIINVFECSECGGYGEKYRELTRYAYTTYIKPRFYNHQLFC